jgi:hypothetical protein
METTAIKVTCECNEALSVDEVLSHLAQKTGVDLESDDDSNADYRAGFDDGEAEPSDEETYFE